MQRLIKWDSKINPLSLLDKAYIPLIKRNDILFPIYNFTYLGNNRFSIKFKYTSKGDGEILIKGIVTLNGELLYIEPNLKDINIQGLFFLSPEFNKGYLIMNKFSKIVHNQIFYDEESARKMAKYYLQIEKYKILEIDL